MDCALNIFLFLSVSSTCSPSMGPIFSPIKSLIALGNKESINPVSANKAPAVWQEAANMQQSPALLVVDIMLCLLASLIFSLSLPVCVPVFFLCPSFSFSLFSPGTDRKSVNLLCVSVFTSVQSQTPLVGSVDPQEMALFGSTETPLCLCCQEP